MGGLPPVQVPSCLLCRCLASASRLCGREVTTRLAADLECARCSVTTQKRPKLPCMQRHKMTCSCLAHAQHQVEVTINVKMNMTRNAFAHMLVVSRRLDNKLAFTHEKVTMAELNMNIKTSQHEHLRKDPCRTAGFRQERRPPRRLARPCPRCFGAVWCG